MRVKVGNQVGELTNLPGCSQIVVSHDVFSTAKNSGKGVKSNSQRIELCMELGYDVLLCTVDMRNDRQVHILEKNFWTKAFEFVSSKTEHTVGVFYRPLNNGEQSG